MWLLQRPTQPCARLDDQQDNDRKPGGKAEGRREFALATAAWPIDAGRTPRRDQRGIEFRRRGIDTGQGGAGTLGMRLEREYVGLVAAMSDSKHATMLMPTR